MPSTSRVLAMVLMMASLSTSGGEERELPPLPQGLTSFGAAVSDGWLYVYGGHAGRAHTYSIEDQSRAFYRLRLEPDGAWERIGDAPAIQGLAFVAEGGKLYRLGGLLVENHRDQEQQLRSTAEVAAYDPATRAWSNLPPLPEPRSSLDAVVIDKEVFVVGGWRLEPGQEPVWLDTAWRMDLTAESPQWRPLAAPGFQRRALAVGACHGQLFALGGMQSDGEITRAVAVYDPKQDRWSSGPEMPGATMDGFGAACFEVDGRLLAATYSGQVLELSEDHASWKAKGKLASDRFFHRLLAWKGRGLVVGGTSMESGKKLHLEIID